MKHKGYKITLILLLLGILLEGQPHGQIARARPQWALQGRIVFQSNRGTSDRNIYQIYVMHTDGSDQLRLTDKGNNWFASFSPDGQDIAFVSEHNGNWNLCIMAVDGTQERQLTKDLSVVYQAAWSPDGKQLAFTISSGTSYQIYAINADGSGLVKLTDNPNSDLRPAWAPDGQHIAFASTRDSRGTPEQQQLYVMNADGTHQTRLTQGSYHTTFPTWSPDGRQLAFTLLGEQNSGIYIINADGSGLTNLASLPVNTWFAEWSLDSRWLAVVVNKHLENKRPDSVDRIFVVDATGANPPIQLTDDTADAIYPSWGR